MASGSYMQAPMCLIENSQDGKLVLNGEAFQLLSSIKETLVVVSIVGFYRTGKSYLMNRLAGQNHGFSLGSTVQSHTKGIWMWCVPHPEKRNHCLVLLDTEGLGDVEKGDHTNDCWIFSLAVLLSSTFVYNSVGTIDQYALEKLHFVSNLTELIKVKADQGGDDEDEELDLLKVSPAFVWAVRDFTLELKIDGQNVTADEYLNHGLQLKKGVAKKVMEYNQPRECIRNYFRSRKCFVFVQPTASTNLNQVETLPESQLDPQFRAVCREFCQYIYSESQPKRVKGGRRINGRMLAILTEAYVKTIDSGKVPCIEDAVTCMAKIENTAAFQNGLTHYQQQMGLRVQMPMEIAVLTGIHSLCRDEAIQLFLKSSFNDKDQEYYKKLLTEVEQHYFEVCDKNEAVSMETCTKLLETLSSEIEEKLRKGSYTCTGGYEQYEKDRKKMIEKFHATPGKGNKAEEALNSFMKSKTSEADSVLQADERLTDQARELAVERQRTAEIKQEAKAQEEALKTLEEIRNNEKAFYEESTKQLHSKMEEEKENLQREQELALECKLKEQKELMEKQFQSKAEMMEEQIETLRKQQESANSSINWEKFATVAKGALDTIINAYASHKAMKLLTKI
ncbi:guanylate-binding protein 1-like [Chiloscyllium plagiosum]|uniref:guanylate-binding protein 1-like n=1 Tax=Chiloscyllium plagiosum TaxID=36176 RepID=UPI001CB7F1CE|nr:guanylate-binding protein 1-like [Chiloscyllium plagiosum]